MGLGESRNLFQTETPHSVTNSTNTPRDYCVKKHVYRPCSPTKCMCKISLKAIEKLLDKVFFFYYQNYKFWSINSFINYFLKEPGNLELVPLQIMLGKYSIFSFRIQKRRWIRGYFEGLEKMALESVLFNKTLVIKKLHPQQIESQAQHTDSCIA